MRIAVTDILKPGPKFQSYLAWLSSGPLPVQCETLSHKLNNGSAIEHCDALVLTGGHDVEPSLYKGPQAHPTITDVDPGRDKFEQQLINAAMHRRIPLLAICRGMQLVNVHFGGTLIPDIEEAGYRPHRAPKGAPECRHPVTVDAGSRLSAIVKTKTGEVNSSHHQAVGKPGKRLVATARSADGIIEAMELESAGEIQFFLLVQWHPERMADTDNPFCKEILTHFLHSIQLNTQAIHYTQKEHSR